MLIPLAGAAILGSALSGKGGAAHQSTQVSQSQSQSLSSTIGNSVSVTPVMSVATDRAALTSYPPSVSSGDISGAQATADSRSTPTQDTSHRTTQPGLGGYAQTPTLSQWPADAPLPGDGGSGGGGIPVWGWALIAAGIGYAVYRVI